MGYCLGSRGRDVAGGVNQVLQMVPFSSSGSSDSNTARTDGLDWVQPEQVTKSFFVAAGGPCALPRVAS